MRPRHGKNSGRYRSKPQSCPSYLRSTWPTINSDHDDTITDMATLRAAMRLNGMVAGCSSQMIHTPNLNLAYKNRKFGRHSSISMTSSTPVLRSLGETDDTEDEGFIHRRCSSVSSCGSGEYLSKQTASMGSLTSSYSSLGERSASTLSPFDDLNSGQTLSTSLKAILDPDFPSDFPSDFSSDYDDDLKMRRTVEDIVSPKVRMRETGIIEDLAVVDPSVLIAVPGRSSVQDEINAEKYAPTDLCDFSGILSNLGEIAEVTDPQPDLPTELALLRVGSLPINDKTDVNRRRGWEIPDNQEQEEQVGVPETTISYQLLSESSDSDDDYCPLGTNLNLSSSSSSASIWTLRSRSSSIASSPDSSDYLADISSEETTSARVTVWPVGGKLKLQLEKANTPFVLPPRILGVPYYGSASPTFTDGEGDGEGDGDGEGNVSQGLEAFFKNRSIVHRLGPHGLEQVYDMELCPEKCGFTYPVPLKQEVKN